MSEKFDTKKETEKKTSALPVLSFRQAKERGLMTVSQMKSAHLRPGREPAALVRNGTSFVRFFDPKKAAGKRESSVPLLWTSCRQCGQSTPNPEGLCQKCRAKLRNGQNASQYREEKASAAGKDLSRMVFLDLEMTGDARADEVLSVSMTDGYGNVLFNSLIHPEKAKKWPYTVKIHHITPQMVAHSPRLSEVEPILFRILMEAEEILGYSIGNDWLYLRRLPSVAEHEEEIGRKIRCCQKFYEQLLKEDRPDLDNGKRSLETAMSMLGLSWPGRQHASLADTKACAQVWRRIFLEPEKIPPRPPEEMQEKDPKEKQESITNEKPLVKEEE